jgi:catechol 2,3-dioxygenase-like lactoylglutathione lyase family enzyme
MRVLRIAVPASEIVRSHRFYEDVLGVDADDTVPSRDDPLPRAGAAWS